MTHPTDTHWTSPSSRQLPWAKNRQGLGCYHHDLVHLLQSSSSSTINLLLHSLHFKRETEQKYMHRGEESDDLELKQWKEKDLGQGDVWAIHQYTHYFTLVFKQHILHHSSVPHHSNSTMCYRCEHSCWSLTRFKALHFLNWSPDSKGPHSHILLPDRHHALWVPLTPAQKVPLGCGCLENSIFF